MPTLAALREELEAKQDQLHAIFAKYDNVASMSDEDASQVKARNDELTELSKKVEEGETEAAQLDATRKGIEDARLKRSTAVNRPPLQAGDPRPATKSISQIIDESTEYKAFRDGLTRTARFELPGEAKTLMTLSTYNNVPTRLPGILEMALEDATVADLMLQGSTDNNTITYMEETTVTNNAAEVDEAGLKPESALAYTERTENVRKIATWIPATKELLDDVPAMRSIIEGRLMFMVRRREEQQLLTGDGTAPNISGILDRSIQTQAKGTDPTPDAIYKAMTKIRTGVGSIGSEPTAVVFHPNDWQDIRLLRTSNDVYIFGPPSDAGIERIWGLPIRQTTAMTENTALVGAFRPDAQIFRRSGIEVTISTEHSDYFVYNKVAILAEERLALAVYRPKAFCSVTGI